MKKLTNKLSVGIVLFSFLLLTACGRISPNTLTHTMSEQEATGILAELPADGEDVSAQGFLDAIQELHDNGDFQAPRTARFAADGSLDLSTLTTLLALLGDNQDIAGVATGLVNANDGNTTQTGSKLDGIMSLLTAVAPILSTFFPQFAPIISAVMAIIPIVQMVIGLFGGF